MSITKEEKLAQVWPKFLGFLRENFDYEFQGLGILGVEMNLCDKPEDFEKALHPDAIGRDALFNAVRWLTDHILEPVMAATDLSMKADEILGVCPPWYVWCLQLETMLNEMDMLSKTGMASKHWSKACSVVRENWEHIGPMLDSLMGGARYCRDKPEDPGNPEATKSYERLFRWAQLLSLLTSSKEAE